MEYGKFDNKTEMLNAAKTFLNKNPDKNLSDFRSQNPGVPQLQIKERLKNGNVKRVAIRSTRLRNRDWTKPKTAEERKERNKLQKKVKNINQNLLSQAVHGTRKVVLEHDIKGRSDAMSISDPDFASHKTTLESKVKRRFGSKVKVGINSQGETIVGPSASWNDYDPESSPGIKVIPQGSNMNTALKNFAAVNLRQTKLKAFNTGGRLETYKGSVRDDLSGFMSNPYGHGIDKGNRKMVTDPLTNLSQLWGQV